MAPFRSLSPLLLPLAAACLLAGCGPEEETAACLPQEVIDGPLRTDYPTDNLGVATGDTLENLAFTTPEDEPFDLNALYEQPGNKLLMLVTASGWCTACIEEQPKLQALYDEHRCRGLEIMVAVFEDQNYEDATHMDAASWRRRFGLTFPVVADETFEFGAYYDSSLTPMVMMVDAETMEILWIATGYDESRVMATINAYL